MGAGDGLDGARREAAYQRWLDSQEKDMEIMARLIDAAFRAGWDAARKVTADDR